MYHLFGDESESYGIIAYGIIICPETALPKLNSCIHKVKEKYGVSSNTRFHCRELFNGDLRRKSAWCHLSERQSYDLAVELTNSLCGLGLQSTLGIIDSRPLLGAKIKSAGDGHDHKLRVKEHLTPLAFQGAIGPLLLDAQFKGKMKLWVDLNDTKIEWFGKKNKAHTLLKTGELVDKPFRIINELIPENIQSRETPQPLEIADLLAYCGARVVANKKRKYDHIFEAIIKTINPAQHKPEWNLAAFDQDLIHQF